MAQRPLVIAHRGASAAAPENTLAAFAAAADQGADWVELDVRCCAGGALVLLHDAALPDGRVLAETPCDQLPPSVATLAAALEVCRERGLAVNVEIKALPGEADEHLAPALADAVVDLLLADGEVGGGTELLVTCFDPRTLDRVAQRAAGALPTGLLSLVLDGAPAAVEAAVAGGHRALNPWDATATAELVERARAQGLEVNVWTVDDPDRMVELASWGVTGVITNEPAVARRALGG